ncbi:hypothetical protein EMIHUDRAFT_230633 [Emiliania huxleyi CCMP1516]|uniref:Uncharacterized protein n=2 Tax=Emiliania huxleyi TaxID=2903 RepID=A0A0D3KA59_EMIH1|nr:hypothetical protein EMIHUDRAFT_230633 [Emiliania huxleyi CCMP1516]EOD32644.1 hypothetical protein EMIHUDRAFT_230633 [Emiliania huxleyi CCMP1516]|eukprot:XP_005785073.1 hypothetical protein EMIHUDRAFT_230633 [Emiliania huxleyi CCMP1516]
MPAMTSANRPFAGGSFARPRQLSENDPREKCASAAHFSSQAVTAALATLASLEGSPGPAAALARPTGGLMLIDAFTLVGLAGKYASRSGLTPRHGNGHCAPLKREPYRLS